MTTDPRLALRGFAAALLALVVFGLQWANAPEALIPLVTAAWMAGLGVGEVYWDNRKKPASWPSPPSQ